MMRKFNRSSWGTLSLVVMTLLGAALRFGFNSVLRYGNGDEYHYRLQVQAIYENGWSGFRELVRAHLTTDPAFPAPYRWGYLALGHLACATRHVCDERSLAWVSTVSGFAVVGLVALLGAKLFGKRTALVASALAVTSPLHLELSRRAYGDELHTACLLLALLALAHFAIDPWRNGLVPWVWGSLAMLALTLGWSVKESIVFFVPALAVWLFWLRQPSTFKWADASFLLVPPAIAVSVFAWLNRGIAPLLELLTATRQSFLNHYSSLNQYGPPHRPLIELFTLAPLVFALLPVVIAAAFGEAFQNPSARGSGTCTRESGERRRAQALALVFALIGVAFLVLPKNVRFYAVLDPLAALLVAWCACEAMPGGRVLTLGWWSAILLCHAAFELALFHRTFVVSAVTDPTANAIFRALQMVPGEGVERRWHPPLLVVTFSLLSVCAAWISAYLSKFRRQSLIGAIVLSVCALGLPQLFRPFRTIIGAVAALHRDEQ